MKKQLPLLKKRSIIKFLSFYFLSLLIIAACHKDNTAVNNSNSFFDYSGKDAFVKKTLGQLQKLDIKQPFADSVGIMGKADWNTYLKSWLLKKDTLEQYTVNIPIVDKKSVLVGYIAVEILNNEATKKPVFYSYQKNYINNTSVFNKYIIGNVFNGFGSKNVVLPSGFKKLQEYYTKLTDNAAIKNKENFKIAVQDFIGKPINSKLKTLDDNPEPTCDVTLAIRYIYQGVNGTSGSESQSTINAMLVNRVQNIYFAGTNVHVGLTYEGVTISGPTSIVGYFNVQNVVTELERIPGVEGVTNVQVTSSCQMGPTNPIDPGGGGENQTVLTENDLDNAVPVDDGKPHIDVQKYINCFNDGNPGTYKLTMYIDQPKPGTNSQFLLDPGISPSIHGALWFSPNNVAFGVGHAFIGFEKHENNGTVINQTLGFYPANGFFVSSGEVKDDAGHPYNISYTITVTESQFNAAINSALNDDANTTYFVKTYNCSDAALKWVDAAGAAIPSVSRGVFNNTPGDLGQAIKQKTGAQNYQSIQNAPASHGPCI